MTPRGYPTSGGCPPPPAAGAAGAAGALAPAAGVLAPAAGVLALVAGVLALVAGCTAPAADRSTAPAEPLPSSAVPVPVTSPTPIPGLRPLTPAQRQQRYLCRQRIVKNGCEFYNDDSLRLQGIDPDSAPAQSGPTQPTVPTN